MSALKTLAEYLSQLGWDRTELARQAGLNFKTVQKAVDGDMISSRSARAIASALSKATGQQVLVGDVQGLIIEGVSTDTTPTTQ